MNEKKLMVYANKTGGMIARAFSSRAILYTLDRVYIRNGSITFIFNTTEIGCGFTFKTVATLGNAIKLYENVDIRFNTVAYNMCKKLKAMVESKNYVSL